MPYKDKEYNREYQREWMRRKKRGKTTALGLQRKVTPDESRRKRLSWRRRAHVVKREILLKKFGKNCFFCGRNYMLRIHREDGNPHPYLGNLSMDSINKLTGYTTVCFDCHKHIHWCMEFLGMSWPDIVSKKIVPP